MAQRQLELIFGDRKVGQPKLNFREVALRCRLSALKPGDVCGYRLQLHRLDAARGARQGEERQHVRLGPLAIARITT